MGGASKCPGPLSFSSFPMSYWVVGPARCQPAGCSPKTRICDATYSLTLPSVETHGRIPRGLHEHAKLALTAGPVSCAWTRLDPSLVRGEQKQVEPCWSGDLGDGLWCEWVSSSCLG